MQPVVGYRAEGETVHVLQGQRRTLAAVEAGRESIPVYLANNPDDAGRIVSQMIENDQRTGFTDAERADGYEQFSLLGMTAGQIARRTHSTEADRRARPHRPPERHRPRVPCRRTHHRAGSRDCRVR